MAGPLIAVVGETAAGKSALALELAQAFHGEIVGADSWTVYREFNIGTAKPSAAEMALVPHHLFDIRNAPDGFNAALFKQLANQTIDTIHQKGKLPILVGGTGLYVDSILFDFSFLPPGEPAERERRDAMQLGDLLAEAASQHISLTGVDIRNKRRVIRALETGGAHPQNTELRSNTLVLGVGATPDELRERITRRVDAMVAAGLEQEARQLADKYGWDAEPMKGIGYHEWREYITGQQTAEQVRQRIIGNTLKLARRQRAWFRRNKAIYWVTSAREARIYVENWLIENSNTGKNISKSGMP